MHKNRGLKLHRKGQLEEAVSCYRKALQLNPNLAGVYNNMGAGLQGLGRLEEAISSFEMAVEIRPDYIEAHNNMGNLLQQMGRIDEAISSYHKVLELEPDLSEAHNNLGNAYHHMGQLSEAISCYQKALELRPDNAQAYCNLGNGYQIEGRIDQAIFCYNKAVTLNPDNPEAYNNMGAALKHCGRLEEAVSCHRKALELEPGNAVAHNNLGSANKHQGKLPEAMACYRKACHLKRDYAEAHSNLILAMQYDQTSNLKEIYYESSAWWKQHRTPNRREFVHHRSSDSTKNRLRIGYVSPDFRDHSVSYFFLPLLEAHDRREVEVFCYAEVKRADKMTARIKSLSDHWRSTVGLPSDAVAQQIYEDGIDILVDLAGHTANNRLLVFAGKPAPVQVTWLGYPGTTGMEVMDYRLTDEIADPAGDADKYHSEALIRLPQGFLCYSPPETYPDVSDLPSIDRKRTTFGSFNNLPKVNERVVEIWSQILLQTPGSSLLLKSRQLKDDRTRRRYMDLFTKNGINCERIEMLPATASISEHLDLYNRVDIGLDPFPYNGTTTTCEALWMGVPVVTLRGDRHSSRVGASILTRVGLKDFITENEGEYISKTVELASNLDRLKELRAGMRRRMMESPLCNPESFARSIEKAYREIWKTFCDER
jgi:protein O-GlcNAc transferase